MVRRSSRSQRQYRRDRSRRIVGTLVLILFLTGMGLAGAFFGYHYHLIHADKLPLMQSNHNTIVIPVSNSNLSSSDPLASSVNLLTKGTVPVPIIMYHDVVPRKQVWFDMTTDEFSAQMADLAAAHAHPISIQALYDNLQNGAPLPARPILLTFDDCTLGQFTQALPILKQRHFPAVFFVQTASVGITTPGLDGSEKDHMTWDQLKQAEATGLITVESHTVTHPEDMTAIPDYQLTSELQDSKQTLEAHLGHPIKFLAYPSGTCDARVSQVARDAGYLAAVTMDRGWAASPAQSYFLPRLTPKRVEEVISTWNDETQIEPPLPRLMAVNETSIQYGIFKGGRFPVQWLAGGDLATEALDQRETVGQMALEANASAALNGSFFSDARIAGTNGLMIGPCLNRTNGSYQPSNKDYDPRIEGRPLLLFGDKRFLVLPYTAHLGATLSILQQLMPDVKDAFLAGGWIVHYGKALPDEEMARWASSDLNDPRHRAFVGIDRQNRYILGATQDSISSRELAQILVQMGVQEAYLLDSGFSASLIWQNHVLVSGHSQMGVPSRPVPHALFLLGATDPTSLPPPPDSPIAAGPGAATLQDALSADSTAGAARYYTNHRHYRRSRRRRLHRNTHETISPAAQQTSPP